MIKRSGPCRTRPRLRGGLALAAVAAGGALAGEASAGDLGVALEDGRWQPARLLWPESNTNDISCDLVPEGS
jgi:hypothetical protein